MIIIVNHVGKFISNIRNNFKYENQALSCKVIESRHPVIKVYIVRSLEKTTSSTTQQRQRSRLRATMNVWYTKKT